MIVHQHSNVKIEYDSFSRRLTQTWTGFIVSKEFRIAIDKTVEFVNQNPVVAIISDTLNQGVVKPEDTEYAAAVMPQLFKSGLKKMAFVLPENIFTQFSLKRFANKGKSDNIQYFRTLSEAVDWLSKF